jgi:hypothetical protein
VLNVALEAVAVLGPVDLEKTPCFRKSLLTDTELDGRGGDDAANDALS